MESLFVKQVFFENVKLSSNQLNNKFKDSLLAILQTKLEGKCSRYGYIKRNTIEILKFSPGNIRMFSLNGDAVYVVQFSGLVCNPSIGSMISGKISNTNKFGVLITIQDEDRTPFIDVIVPNNTNIDSDISVLDLSIGDNVNIEIIGKKFSINDAKISAIGKIKTHTKPRSDENNMLHEPSDIANDVDSVDEDEDQIDTIDDDKDDDPDNENDNETASEELLEDEDDINLDEEDNFEEDIDDNDANDDDAGSEKSE
jgi:DNA-directed RNA polymerase subunit E'/Rpb7